MSRRSAADRLRAAGQPIGELYLGRNEIAARVAELGREIAAAYTGRVPLGAFAAGSYTLAVEANTRAGIPSSASQQLRFEVTGDGN